MDFRKLLLTNTLVLGSVGLAHADGLWMSDGSEVVFSDTVKISEAEIPDGGQPYEGAVDSHQPLGMYQLPVNESVYVSVEAEWVVVLPEDHGGHINADTPVTLQGMVDGKYFAEFLSNQTKWLPASLGNNLIAAGPGIETTLAQLTSGGLHAQIEVGYIDAYGRAQTFTSNSDALTGVPLMNLVNGVLARSPETNAINLGAIGSSSAFVNDENIRNAAIVKSIFQLPFSGLPLCIDSIKQLTLKNISKKIINKKMYMTDEAYITVTDANGAEIGSGLISIQ